MTTEAVAAPVGPQRSAKALAGRLEALASGDESYWSFERRDEREFVHSLFHYPAMMVPRLQRELLETCVNWDSLIGTVYDPFVGSGTVMTEAMLLGLNFVGGDINPLAVLVAQAKAGTFDADTLECELRRLLKRSTSDSSNELEVDFPNLDKWFTPAVAVALSRLRRAISGRRSAEVRRFFWVALAETIRLSSNSRTSTVKLHLRPAEEVASRPDAVAVFREVATRNLRVLREQQRVLKDQGLLSEARYAGKVSLEICDVCETTGRWQADLLMTSPPYGDNHTTVTYGQASYLPLQWIDRSDILGYISEDCVENTHRTDTLSLGGSRKGALDAAVDLLDRSPHLRRVMDDLGSHRKDARTRVAAFYRDLDASLSAILSNVRAGGLLLWTTGDRSVTGVTVRMAPILRELLGRRVELVTTLDRQIPPTRKRMAPRNAITSTMGAETILVVRKLGDNG